MKILIVDDDPISRRILENLLCKWGYTTVSAENGADAWAVMQASDAPNLVISDWMMPNLTGIELCERIRKLETPGYTYVILLTAKTDKKDLLQGLESGADDFIVKPFDKEELRYRVKIGERIIQLERKIITLANTDYLTGILNRRAFMERVGNEIHRCARHHQSLSIVMMDLDHFKTINDTHGHLVGDFVLKRFAEQVMGLSRPYDILGRYGGEEFIMALPETDLQQAYVIAERIRKKIAETDFTPDGSPQSIRLTASFGVCSDVIQFDQADTLIKPADDALYRAKEHGRNRVETIPER